MAIYINGTSGISGVDGSAGTPAIQGTDPNTGISFPAADTIAFNEGGAEAARIDSSGRFLVGTSTASASSLLCVQGIPGNPAIRGSIHFQPNTNSPAINQGFGMIQFGTPDGNQGAQIYAERDGGTWTAGSSHPGRLVFSTTADGASSPTERMRIDSTGKISASAGSTVTFEASTTGTAAHYNALLNGSQVFVVNFNGDVRIAAGRTYGNLSDASVKENIVDATPKLDDVCRLQVRNFSVKNDAELEKYIGFIAQEFETVFPALVQEDAEGLKGIKESALIPILVKALQESTERIKALEAKVAALEAA